VTRRIAFAIVLASMAVVAMGARCVENSIVRTDGQGYTYLLGEIYNDTDVHGSEMTFRATLFDGAGGLMAAKDVMLCPGDLAPQSHVAYAVRFDEPHLPSPARFEVRPVAGRALERPAPASGIRVASAGAVWRPGSRERLTVHVALRNDGSQSVVPAMCGVTYDLDGKVRSMSPVDPAQFHADVRLDPGETQAFDFSLVGQQGAETVRAWFWFPGDAPTTSVFQPAMTEQLIIVD
jgi:hypothetical protein